MNELVGVLALGLSAILGESSPISSPLRRSGEGAAAVWSRAGRWHTLPCHAANHNSQRERAQAGTHIFMKKKKKKLEMHEDTD